MLTQPIRNRFRIAAISETLLPGSVRRRAYCLIRWSIPLRKSPDVSNPTARRGCGSAAFLLSDERGRNPASIVAAIGELAEAACEPESPCSSALDVSRAAAPAARRKSGPIRGSRDVGVLVDLRIAFAEFVVRIGELHQFMPGRGPYIARANARIKIQGTGEASDAQ